MPAYRIFCSYAHEDERLRARLEEQLAPLRHEGLIDDWYDHEILPGQSYNAAIAVALDAADVILLLVSASFLASDYCYQRELRHALERRRQGQTAVVPVILHDCDWQTSLFGGIEALPDRGQPVSSRRWKNQAEALANIARGIRRLVESRKPRRSPDHGPRDHTDGQLEAMNDDALYAPASPAAIFDSPHFSDAMPRPSIFDSLLDAITQAPIVAVGGISGVGKTYSTSEFLNIQDSRRDNLLTFWYDPEEKESLEFLLSEINAFVNLNSHALMSRCKELAAKLRERKALLIIDNFHNVEDSYAPLIRSAVRQRPPAILILITQKQPRIMEEYPSIAHINMTGFSLQEIRIYLSVRGITTLSDDHVRRLKVQTDGLPLAVSLFCTLMLEFDEGPDFLLSGELSQVDVVSRWFCRVVELLDKDSRSLLYRLSVLDSPFNTGLAGVLADKNDTRNSAEHLRTLKRTYMVQRHSPYRWKVHEILSRRCRRYINPEVIDKVHWTVAKYYLRGLSANKPSAIICDEEFKWKARALDHMLRSQRHAESEQLFHQLVATAKARGRYQFITTFGERFCRQLRDRSRWIDYHCAHAYLILGSARNALSIINAVLSESEQLDVDLVLAGSRLRAEALMALEMPDAAHAELGKALAASATAAVRGTTRDHAESTMAWVCLHQGLTGEAIKIAQKLLVHAEMTQRPRGGAIALTILGTALTRTGMVDAGITHLEHAVKLFRESQDRRGEAWALAELAECFVNLKDGSRAVVALTKAAKIWEDIGECGANYVSLIRRLEKSATHRNVKRLISAEHDRISDLKLMLSEEHKGSGGSNSGLLGCVAGSR